MKLLKLLAILFTLFTANITAATISGNLYCDINDNGTIETGEVCPSEAVWIKLLNVQRDRLIAQVPLYPSGAFEFNVNVTGDFILFIDNNGDAKDSIPTPPSNALFGDPVDGSLSITIATDDEMNDGNDFVLIPDPSCDCTSGDNSLTIAPIEIDGVMNDWTTVLSDPDNGRCDSGTITDHDINKTINGVIQSTGRNLTRFVWTGQNDPNGFVYGYTERVGSSTNTETFLFYKDGDGDGLMEAGDIALVAGWQGNTGTVKMEICDYVVNTTDGDASSDFMVWQQSDVGTPLSYPGGTTVPQEWVGTADGYTIQGGLTNCRTAPGLVGIGSADGRMMEWQVPWQVVDMLPFQPITYHVSTMNASVNDNNPPGQVDDNLGSCTLQAPVAKLDVNKTVDNPIPRIGENVTYTITVTNSGGATNSVVVNDTLPPNMTYVSFSGTDWTCSNTGQDVNCSYNGVLLNGGNSSVDIVASLDNDTSLWGEIRTNTACASSDGNTTLVCDSADITIYSPQVALDLSKTVSNATPFEGASIFYTISVTNNGPDIANNIAVYDALPSAGVSYTDYYGDDWACIESPADTLDCTYNVGLGVGEMAELFIIVDVVGSPGTDYINTATANADENTTDVSGSVTINPVLAPSPATVTIEKGVSNSNPLTGDTIVYGIILSNVGGSNATNLTLSDLLPSGVTYVSTNYDTTLGGTFTDTPPDGNITWTNFDLVAGTSTIIQITATVNAVENTTVNNEACANIGSQSPVCTNVDFTVRVPDVELIMDKSVDNENPRVGDTVTYTLLVTNNGIDTANNVVVNDILPGEVTYVSDSPSAGTYNGTTWEGFNIPANGSEELNITISIDTGTEGITVSNLAIVSADENSTDVQDDANLTVYEPVIILGIQKVADQISPAENANITYTIIVNNTGDDNASNISVIDTLPADVTYVGAGGNGWICSDNGTIDCTYSGQLAPGIPTSFDINVTANPGTAGTTLTNTVCIDDPALTTPICGESNINVNDDLDLAVTKDVNNTAPSEGETILYTITVTNNGPITATNVEVTEDVYHISGLTNISTVPALADDDTWMVGDLNAGETATLLVTATVAAGTGGDNYINNAILTGFDQTDIAFGNNQATASIDILPENCPCDDVSSDSSPAMNKMVGVLMIITTMLIGLFFVRREEKYYRNER